MSEQSPQAASAPEKPWYLRWRVWLIAVLIVVGGISAVLNPPEPTPTPQSAANESIPADPNASQTPAEPAPLNLEAYLSDSGVVFDSVEITGRKAFIYVPSETTNEQAQRIADETMLHICEHAVEAGDSFLAANRVGVSDGVSPLTPGYVAADHPSGLATEEVCES